MAVRWNGRRWRWARVRARSRRTIHSCAPRAHVHGRRAMLEVLADGHAHERMELVAATLRARGIEVASDLATDRALLSGLSGDALMAAALACTDELDFRRRIREQLNPHAETRR